MVNEIYSENYFIYKGVAYGVGTKVLFTDDIYQKYAYSSKAKNQPHTFTRGSNTGWKGFYWEEDKSSKFKASNNVSIYNPDEEIKEIVEPVYVDLIPWQQKALDNMINKKVLPDVFGGCLLYVVIMIVGTLFIDRLLIWIFATMIFACWLLGQYRT